MFYTKLYAMAEYAMEILLVWTVFQLSFVMGASYLTFRICRFFLAPAAEEEIQAYRMKQAVAQVKAMTAKLNASQAQKVTALNEAPHEDVTLQ